MFKNAINQQHNLDEMNDNERQGIPLLQVEGKPFPVEELAPNSWSTDPMQTYRWTDTNGFRGLDIDTASSNFTWKTEPYSEAHDRLETL